MDLASTFMFFVQIWISLSRYESNAFVDLVFVELFFFLVILPLFF